MKQFWYFSDILSNIVVKDKEMSKIKYSKKITFYLPSYETHENELTNNWRINNVWA